MLPLLDEKIRRALEPALNGKTVVVTVGNPLRRDDGVGVYIGEKLAPILPPCFRLIQAGFSPERFIDDILSERPAKVIFIDAASFGGVPGEIRVLTEEEVVSVTLSTHTFPLPVIARIVADETGCEVVFVGIQPEDVSFGEGLSEAVERAASAIVEYLGGLHYA